jgi:hypothetical protein
MVATVRLLEAGAQITRSGENFTKVAFLPDRTGDRVAAMNAVYAGSTKPERFLRSLIGVVVAYAVAAQSLLIVLGGFALPAHANDGAPAFELCLHDAQGNVQAASELPAGNPDQSGCTHCVFCFAGSHHAVIGASLAACYRVGVAIVVVPWMADARSLPPPSPYSIASPRGPPLGA